MTAPNSQEGSQQQPALKGLKAAEIALSDPLKAETRKARLYLLGVSLVGITIVQTGLVPQEIATLGITFGEADRQSLLSILALVIVYFTLAFAIYGISDFLAWRYAYANVHWSELQSEARRMAELVGKAAEGAKEATGEASDIARLAARASDQASAARREIEETSHVLTKIAATMYDETLPSVKGADREAQERARNILTTATDAQNKLAGREWTAGGEAALQTELEKKADAAQQKASEAQQRTAQLMEAAREGETEARDGTLSSSDEERSIRRYATLSPTVSWVRALFEFLLPLLVSFYAIYALWLA